MKKIILVLLAMVMFLFSTMAYAGCMIGVNITPDPLADDQELWLNPDGIATNGDEIIGVTLAGNAITGSFLSATDCTAMPNMTVYIESHFPGGIELVSSEVAPSDIVPAILDLAIKHTQ